MNIAALFASLIPSILQFVEDLYGPKSGASKKASAVYLTHHAVQAAAAVGVVTPEEANDASNIADNIQKIFDKNPPEPATSPATPGTITSMSETSPMVD